MSIKEEIHGLTDEILTNLERLVAIDSTAWNSVRRETVWGRPGQGTGRGT